MADDNRNNDALDSSTSASGAPDSGPDQGADGAETKTSQDRQLLAPPNTDEWTLESAEVAQLGGPPAQLFASPSASPPASDDSDEEALSPFDRLAAAARVAAEPQERRKGRTPTGTSVFGTVATAGTQPAQRDPGIDGDGNSDEGSARDKRPTAQLLAQSSGDAPADEAGHSDFHSADSTAVSARVGGEAGETTEAEQARPRRVAELPLQDPPDPAARSWLNDYGLFKLETQKLARIGNWPKIAALTAYALNNAPYARRRTRTALLLELAQIFRDRLKEPSKAEETFGVLADEEPSNTDALAFFDELYSARKEWPALYQRYLAAVETTWDRHDRLTWTQQAAHIAEEELQDTELAIRAWEHLWQLGDAVEEAARELGRHYRRGGRWGEMASFLRQQSWRLEGPAQLVALRELAEVLLSALHSPDEASEVLQQIVQHSPQDGIATLQLARVYAQRQDWVELETLGQEAAASAQNASTDLQHVVASALWDAGRLDQAHDAFERILARDPDNQQGLKRKREYYEQTGRYDQLLALLEERADLATDSERRSELLAEAATIAEQQLDNPQQAIELWESHAALVTDASAAFEALERLHDRIGNPKGVASALSGQLKLTRDPERRVSLLRRLGHIHAHQLGADPDAEDCWKQILSIAPTDLPTREELTELHRRRGDFEALNSSLLRQLWLTDDQERAEKLCRMAAENLDQNFSSPERSIEGWRRVLDFAPQDSRALAQLTSHYETQGNTRELIATLEQRIRAEADPDARIELALRVAALWEQENQFRAAASTYERVLRWAPASKAGLDALVRIYSTHGEAGRALGVLDHAGNAVERLARVDLARQGLGLLDDEAHSARFFALRRLLMLADGDPSLLVALKEASAKSEQWRDFAAVLQLLASGQESEDDRIELLEDLAEVYANHLDLPDLAYLIHQGILLSPDHHRNVAEDLRALAEKTGRFEDYLVVIDRLAAAELDPLQRKAWLLQRAELCEKHLDAPWRAFQEYHRCLVLDRGDATVLAELKRIANAHQLHEQLDAVLAELYDQTEDNEGRLGILTDRQQLAEARGDPKGAFEFLVRRYRLAPEDLEVLRALTEDAAALEAWDWLLPLLEAAQLAAAGAPSADELTITSALYEEKLRDLDRAFMLYREVFVLNPNSDAVLAKLEELAEGAGTHEQLADALRMAAASAAAPEQTLKLLRKIASIYETKLASPERAIDIHRRLLVLKSDELSSLNVMIDSHRQRSEWRDLRDRLRQRHTLAAETSAKIAALREIAELSEQRLGDPEHALEAYGEILELDPEHGPARAGLDGLVSALHEPGLRKRWLQMQLPAANASRALELRLEIARTLEQDLDDVATAIETLQAIESEAGPINPGFDQLARLLAAEQRHLELAELFGRRAQALEDPAEQVAQLQEAIAVVQRHTPSGAQELLERFYRLLLSLAPTDRNAFVQLGRILRASGRWEDLVAHLSAGLNAEQSPEQLSARRYAIARIASQQLDRQELALETYEQILASDPNDEAALLALAAAAWQREDYTAYLDLRGRQAALLDPSEGAIVLCHLAEVCDEVPSLQTKMVAYYREARTLDPDNVPAMEALKGIGRRLKTLRPAAALLPEAGERELSLDQRADRFLVLAKEALPEHADAALCWLNRSVAVAPQRADVWERLATILTHSGNHHGAFRAHYLALRARQAALPLADSNPSDEAELLHQLARAAEAAGLREAQRAFDIQAFELAPSHAPAALATARTHMDQGDNAAAELLLNEVIEEHRQDLNPAQLASAFYCRGIARRQAERREQARDDLMQSLKLEPLYAPCLIAIGDLQAELGLFGGAIEHHIRALAVTGDDQARARQYYRIGTLWEDGLERYDEAGACYELAVAASTPSRDLLHRTLRHYKRYGRLDESLDVVEGLLPTAEDSEELATLWLVRGEILATREGFGAQAIEAFDMALSYDPSRQRARDGLVAVLEERGDWNQVLQVLEASADSGPPRQRGAALVRLAEIATERLGQQERAEAYLRAAVETYPTRAALDQLEQLCADRPDRVRERLEVLGLLVAFGPPWFERCVKLGQLLLEDEKERAWCLLSPLLGVSQVDAELKSAIQAMRKDYERPPIRFVAARDTTPTIVHPDADRALAAVFNEVQQALPQVGLRRLEDLGETTIAVGTNTSLGRTFAQLAEAVGLVGTTLHRTQTLPAAAMVVNEADGPKVVVRTDVMQQLVHAEVGFLFAYALELARPGHRLMASLPPELRIDVVPGLWHALGMAPMATGDALVLSEMICAATDEATRRRWAGELAHLSDLEPRAYGLTWWQATLASARRVGLIAGPDLRQAFRLVSRMDEGVPRPRVVARIEDLDEYLQQADVLQDIVSFAASPTFARILSTAAALDGE